MQCVLTSISYITLLVAELSPAISLFRATTVQNLGKTMFEEEVFGFLTASPASAMGDDGRIFGYIGQRHGVGGTVPNQVSRLGSIRLGRQGSHGQRLLIARFGGGVGVPHVDHQERITSLSNEGVQFLGLSNTRLAFFHSDGGSMKVTDAKTSSVFGWKAYR